MDSVIRDGDLVLRRWSASVVRWRRFHERLVRSATTLPDFARMERVDADRNHNDRARANVLRVGVNIY